MSEPIRHIFQPLVTLEERSDGNYSMTVDWSDSYSHTFDPNTQAESDEGTDACYALDAWVSGQPPAVIVHQLDENAERDWLVEVLDDSGSHTNRVSAVSACDAAEQAAEWSGRPVTDVLAVRKVL